MSDIDLTDRAAVNEAVMTVPEFLALVAAGDRKADEMVCDVMLVPDGGRGWGHPSGRMIPRGTPFPYATAGADHPERWTLFGEMVDALAATITEPRRWQLAVALRRIESLLLDGIPLNAAAAVALLLAHGILKEDER